MAKRIIYNEQARRALERGIDILAGTVVVAAAGAHLNHFAHLGLFLGGVREQDAAGGLFLGFRHLDEDAIAEGLDGGDAEGNSSHGLSRWIGFGSDTLSPGIRRRLAVQVNRNRGLVEARAWFRNN